MPLLFQIKNGFSKKISHKSQKMSKNLEIPYFTLTFNFIDAGLDENIGIFRFSIWGQLGSK